MIEVFVRYRHEVERDLFAQLSQHSFRRTATPYELNVHCLDREEADLLVINLNQQEGLEASIQEPWEIARRGAPEPPKAVGTLRAAKGENNG